MRAARSSGLPLSVLGGGHDWAGSAIRDGGLLVDLSPMRQVTVDGAEARVAGGTTVSDVPDAARPHGYGAAVGTVGAVGYAGLTLGGGYGTLIGVTGLGPATTPTGCSPRSHCPGGGPRREGTGRRARQRAANASPGTWRMSSHGSE